MTPTGLKPSMDQEMPYKKGEIVWKIPLHVINVPHVPMTSLIPDHQIPEQLDVYFMLMNGHIFLVNTSFNIKFSSIMNMQGRENLKQKMV